MKYKERLDQIFSAYVRYRDCPNGIGRCISCGAIITPQYCDAGHFIPRIHTSTRWNIYNVNAQCKICNQSLRGNLKAYRTGLIEKYGLPVVEQLEKLKNTTVKLSQKDIDNLTVLYRKKLKTVKL